MTEQEFYEWVGKRIREFRKSAKMTLEEVCEEVKIYPTDLSKFEKYGDKIRSAYTIKEIVEATGHTLSDLYADGKKKPKLTLTLQASPRAPLPA